MAVDDDDDGSNFVHVQVIGEWKLKVEDLCSELEASQRECRSAFRTYLAI